MFTGLIESLGTITSIKRSGSVHLIGIVPDASDFIVPSGGSVSISGACLTLESIRKQELFFNAVHETMERTTIGRAKTGDRVNMERSLVIGGRLDGHWVLGHVDGVGTIRSRHDSTESCVLTVEVPESVVCFMAEKGSVAIDGISLTIAKTGNRTIDLALIPATLRATTLGLKKGGDPVNVEADVLARYVHAANGNAKPAVSGETLLSKMERFGF
jgi:riboflavin synthase